MRVLLGAATIALCAAPAFAIPAPGTIMTSAYPITQGGERTGCSIEFSTIVEDNVYKQGGWIALTGNVTLHGFVGAEARPAVTVKAVINDMTPIPGDYTLTPSVPTTVTLLGKGDASNRSAYVDSFVSDVPGGLMTVYRFDDSFLSVYERIVGEGTIMLAISRREGGLDLRVPIDLGVLDVINGEVMRGQDTKMKFLECSGGLIEEVQAALNQ